jgi:transposase
MLTPTVRRTLAPRGQTPVHYCWDRRDRISAISAITVSPKRRRLRLYFELLPQDENVRADDTVDFLRQLKRHIPGPITIVWDRGNVHDRSRAVRNYLAKHPEIVTEKLPGYAPELNPDEGVWDHIKYARLPNFAPRDAMHLRRRLHVEFRLLGRRPKLLAAFIRKTELRLAV